MKFRHCRATVIRLWWKVRPSAMRMIEFAYIARVRHFVELALHGQVFLFLTNFYERIYQIRYWLDYGVRNPPYPVPTAQCRTRACDPDALFKALRRHRRICIRIFEYCAFRCGNRKSRAMDMDYRNRIRRGWTRIMALFPKPRRQSVSICHIWNHRNNSL